MTELVLFGIITIEDAFFEYDGHLDSTREGA